MGKRGNINSSSLPLGLDRVTIGYSEPTGPTTAKPRPPGQRSPFLMIFAGGTPGELIPLKPPRQTVGRGEGCAIRFDDEALSPSHAVLDFDSQGRLRVIDSRSSSGVLVNGVRLLPLQPKPLRSGDRLQLGGVVLKYVELDQLEEQAHRQQFRLTISDPLTGMHNRRHFVEQFPGFAERCRSRRQGVILLMIDLDRFKALNDQLGHLAGDAALRLVASVLGRLLRPEDLAARYGGEEFIIARSAASISEGVALADKIRQGLAAQPFRADEAEWPLSASVGVAFSRWNQPWNGEALIRLADDCLNTAKRMGRDRVVSE